jgi:hypothetical protein
VNRAVTAAVALSLVAGPACDEGTAPTVERREDTASDLADLPLREDEVPEGLAASEEGTGPVASILEVLPPRSALPNETPLPRPISRAFRGGYEVLYLREDGSAAPASAASSVIRFTGENAASGFLAYLREVEVGAGRGPERVEFAAGVGDEAFGWYLEVPFGQSSTVVWRRDDLVLTLALGGRIGSAEPERALALARRVDVRLEGS